MMLTPCKIRCENWYWNRQLQVLLNEKFGVKWSSRDVEFKTFNTRRRGEYLFLIQNPFNKTWWFNWGTSRDFEKAELEETTAKTLYNKIKAAQ